MKWQLKFGYTVLIMLIWLSVVTAVTVVNEDGDAGSLPLPGSAQVVDEEVDLSDGLLEIRGSIVPGNDEDMYRMEIAIPMLFSANTNLPDSVIEDTRLFLFDENGNGVCANHDNPNALPGDPNASFAVIPQGSCQISPGTLIPPGIYFIAISTFERYPVFIADNPLSNIFPDTPRVEVVGPFTSTDPVTGWAGTGQRGDLYIIQLTGVNYPEPECRFVGETIDGNTKTIEYLATDENLGIASVDVTRLELEIDGDPSAPLPEVRIPLGPGNEAVLGAGDRQAIDPPRDMVTINVFNPNRFVSLENEITVTNSIGGTGVCGSVAQGDTEPNPPFCSGPQVIEGEPRPTLEEIAQDTESGIQRIFVDFLRNADLTIDGRPAGPGIENPIVFDPPTTRPITIRAVKIDETQRATVVVFVFDGSGNVSRCDPHILHFVLDSFVERERVEGLGQAEHHIMIQNGVNGITLATVRANDGLLHARRLNDQEEGWVNTETDMVEGNDNRIDLTVIGRRGSEAIVVIADRPTTRSAVTAPAKGQAPAASIPLTLRSKSQSNHDWGGDPR